MRTDWTDAAGTLDVAPALQHLDLLADPVAERVRQLADERIGVVAIDPELADTADFCARYASPPELSANCVVVAGKRSGELRHASCTVLSTTRTDVNGLVKRRLDVRKASFAPMDDAVRLTGMERGGITPLGLPGEWPLLIDERVARGAAFVVGSGLRRSKLIVPGAVLAELPGAEVRTDLGR
ncbi:YbaK/EbsC family protein [Saccharopolyspora sp. HNM0983]|uniref:YbaK/EbsC family protein n=1 Tax=Saccharopolyspora montiporae TaxID=2781240 RepID=A0A929B9V1_9PSEU|nr:YbaK/EbsC family protein [Saccharopolyspora sp. HNM0983]MBE9374850.1 YbaK/EbsC family protein [Saccharopolyspora sp. HNM0983]